MAGLDTLSKSPQPDNFYGQTTLLLRFAKRLLPGCCRQNVYLKPTQLTHPPSTYQLHPSPRRGARSRIEAGVS